MPVYEYRCDACEEQFEEFLSLSTKPAPPCPKCGSKKVTRLFSRINTEWLPSDVAWDREEPVVHDLGRRREGDL
jgi:putative FmdB family regulatory protein